MFLPELLNPFYLLNLCLLAGIGIAAVRGRKAEVLIRERGRSLSGLLVMAGLFVWSFLSLSQVSVFLYFNF